MWTSGFMFTASVGTGDFSITPSASGLLGLLCFVYEAEAISQLLVHG